MDLVLVRGEVDLVQDLELGVGDLDQLLALAPRIGGGARLVGTVVESVDDAVAVLVGVGTAAVLGRTGLGRAAVADVGEPVLVVVGIGASVLVLESVDVFGLLGAGVDAIREPVAVLIRILVGTAVAILDAVLGLGLIRALIDAVEDAVAVLVQRRAAVGRGACLVRALVLLGQEAVAVRIRVGRRRGGRRARAERPCRAVKDRVVVGAVAARG